VEDCKSTQYFKCFKYGHIARACGNVVRCGFCAAPGHKTNNCLQKNTPENHWCAACATLAAKHKAWSPMCLVRQNRVTYARQVYSQRPTKFQERNTPLSTTAPLAPSTLQNPVIAQHNTGSALETAEAMDGLVIPGSQVGNKRAFVRDSSSDDEEPLIRPQTKGRLGRPRKITTTFTGSQSIANFLIDNTPTTPSL